MGRGLVERETQLAALAAAWDEVVRTGHGALVLVRGEAGSGKTALLDALVSDLPGPVLFGACHPLSTPRPLGPFAELAEQLGGELQDVVRGEGRPHEIASALARSAADAGPAIVVLDDLHWADDASLDVLRMLARRVHERALLVLATYRDDEVPGPLQVALGDLITCVRVDVPALSPAGVRALARGTSRDPNVLHQLTSGNAFHVTELLASPHSDLPSTVVDASLARLSRLSPVGRSVAEAVSVVPGSAALSLVAALADDRGVDEAVRAGVLVAHGDAVAFRHEIARLAVEGTLPPYRRRQLHTTALQALLGLDADPARLAHHAEAAGDSAAVVVHAQAAAERASRLGSKTQAARHWEQALRHCPGDDVELRATLLERFSYAAYLVDRMDEAVVALEEALSIRCSLGDRLGEGRIRLDLSRRLACAGRENESSGSTEAGLRVLEQLPPGRDLAMAYALTSYGCFEAHDAEATFDWGRRAVALAREVGAVDIEVYALNTMGTCELFQGRDHALLLESLELAREHGLDEAVGRALMHLAGAYCEQRRLEQIGFVEEAVADCDRRGLELWRRYLAVNLADMQLALGRWDDAAETVAPVLASPSSAPLLRLCALAVAAKVRLRRGDPGAQDLLEQAEAVYDGHDHISWNRVIGLLRAEFAWMAGASAEEMVALTSRDVDEARRAREQWGLDELLRWQRLAGVTDAAALGGALSDEGLSDGGLSGGGFSGVTLWSEPSPAGWRELGAGFEAALALLEQGEAVEALGLLQMVGALGTAARVGSSLRAAGVRELPRGPRTSTRANPAQLTDRELEVLGRLTSGLSNAAIAEELVLSTKTVDKHVSAVLRKLGVGSRHEAAAAFSSLASPALVD